MRISMLHHVRTAVCRRFALLFLSACTALLLLPAVALAQSDASTAAKQPAMIQNAQAINGAAVPNATHDVAALGAKALASFKLLFTPAASIAFIHQADPASAQVSQASSQVVKARKVWRRRWNSMHLRPI